MEKEGYNSADCDGAFHKDGEKMGSDTRRRGELLLDKLNLFCFLSVREARTREPQLPHHSKKLQN